MSLIDVTRPDARSSRPSAGDHEQVDVLGIGFGPSNMALAVALDELPDGERPTAVFLERQPTSAWHRHMLFEDASMQVAFAKDLVTFRNPQSRFSFLQYLVDHDRIADFFNRGSMLPLRTEFSAYLQWAAAQLDDYVRYDSTVVGIEPLEDDGVVTGFRVDAEVRGVRQQYVARDVVLAAGLQPQLPAGAEPGPRVWHTAEFLARVAELPAEGVTELAVVGGGQSAAEAVLYLHAAYPGATIHCVHSGYGYVTSDMTPYANRIFDPSAVDDYFFAPAENRRELFERHHTTNYSAVNPNTIDRIFDADYADRCAGRQRLVWHKASRLTELRADRDGVDLGISSLLTGGDVSVRVDAVVCGTGYRALDPSTLVAGHERLLVRDEDGRPLANRDYSAVLAPESRARLFLVGQTNHTHGISSTLLSNVAVRAGELADTIREAATVRTGGAG
ncbi:lysine N(6)-hydroxylase/L-ornithine N(5)-oxygenase family protein [Nocardioides humi]|uniref:L-lysine N6-monooxygenase MbtG n=1 Tax=Nocardioides humi TaxID=449461 RepID=A0ABN2ACR7_9ACTN|nr:SidA/IucD/PvdA family monooxygenase [Nocardioides humi]